MGWREANQFLSGVWDTGAEHPNKPLQRNWLLEVTAHREMEPFDRAIDLRITRLRRKVEFDPAHPNAIRTVRGIGYMFVPPKN